jgi:hypothetical protein
MAVAFVIVSILLALAMLVSVTMDMRGDPRVVQMMQRFQLRPGFERSLAMVKAIGALGLLVGLFVPAIGIAAATGFSLYFLLAIRAHFRAADPVKEAGAAFGLFVVSVMTAVLGLAS